MFHPDGRWKEFGTGDSEHTIFPFWLFCVVWGVLSYLITGLFVDEPRAAAVVAASLSTTTIASTPSVTLQETEPPEDLVMPLPPKTKGRHNSITAAALSGAQEGNMKPGYYVLDPKGSGVDGVPRYIYIGPEPDGAAEEEA